MASMTNIIFHVTCGQNKKVINSSVVSLRDDIKSAFNLTEVSTLLQRWDADFNDWTDVDDLSALESMDRCKLQVVLRYDLNSTASQHIRPSGLHCCGSNDLHSLPNSLCESACDDSVSDDCFKHSLKAFLFGRY